MISMMAHGSIPLRRTGACRHALPERSDAPSSPGCEVLQNTIHRRSVQMPDSAPGNATDAGGRTVAHMSATDGTTV